MKNIVVRKTRLSDAAASRKLFLEVIKESPDWMLTEADEVPRTVKKEREFISGRLKSPNSALIVAESGGILVGMIGAEGGRLHRTRHTAVVGIFVKKEFRKIGTATALFKALFRWAKKMKITRLTLEVDTGNIAANKLYKKMGFVREGTSKNAVRVNGRYRDHVHMAKILK